ncbi:MAG: hypothetical protein AAGB30_11125 [Pedobacter sp.]|nr:hypothetical protein [Cellulomonas sp.]
MSTEKSKLYQKLYFANIDDCNCYPLSYHLNDAKIEQLNTINLVKAIPDNNNPDYIYCKFAGEVGDKSQCKKSICDAYSSKSGRGNCANRGRLYLHGEEVTFNVQTGDVLKESEVGDGMV